MSDATSICDFWPYWWSSRRPEVMSYPPRCPTPYPLQLVNLRCCSNGAAVPVHPRSRSHDLSRTKPAVYQKPIQLSITRQTILVCLHERACSSATTKCHHLDRWDWPHTDSSLWFIAVNWPAQEEQCKWMKVRGQGWLQNSSLGCDEGISVLLGGDRWKIKAVAHFLHEPYVPIFAVAGVYYQIIHTHDFLLLCLHFPT